MDDKIKKLTDILRAGYISQCRFIPGQSFPADVIGMVFYSIPDGPDCRLVLLIETHVALYGSSCNAEISPTHGGL